MKTNDSIRKETDFEYRDLMLDYIKDKYNREFTVVEMDFPEEGFNTGMLINTLVVQDTETEMIVNVYATLGKPYDFYDNYSESLAGYLLKDSINTSAIDSFSNSKLYVYPYDENVDNININDGNISKVTLVVNALCKPSESALKNLYSVYEQLCLINSEYTFMLVGFTEEREIFTKYTTNFPLYGDRNWSDYPGIAYATMKVSKKSLSYEEFANLCVECW